MSKIGSAAVTSFQRTMPGNSANTVSAENAITVVFHDSFEKAVEMSSRHSAIPENVTLTGFAGAFHQQRTDHK